MQELPRDGILFRLIDFSDGRIEERIDWSVIRRPQISAIVVFESKLQSQIGIQCSTETYRRALEQYTICQISENTGVRLTAAHPSMRVYELSRSCRKRQTRCRICMSV